MVQNFFRNLRLVPLREIDPGDRLLAVSLPWTPLHDLIRSIRERGFLSPLHVQPLGPGRHRPVIGFRRLQAACHLELQEIPCLVRETGSELELFQQSLEDNLTSRGLQLLEKARALHKLSHRFGVPEAALIDHYLPLLGLRPHRPELCRCLQLASLPESLQRALAAGPLGPETALGLSGWSIPEQAFFVDLVSKFRLGKNHQKQLFTLLDELRSTRHLESAGSGLPDTADHLWKESGAVLEERSEQLPLPRRFQQALLKLRQLRYPTLSAHLHRYENLKSALKLPPQIQLQLPPYFEGDRARISLLIRNSGELANLSKKLREISQSPELKEIFQLL